MVGLSWFEIAGSGGGLVTVVLLFRFLNGRINRKVDVATCDTHIAAVGTSQKADIGHLKELVEKDLGHGRQRFTGLEKRADIHDEKLDSLTKIVQSIDKNVAVIARNGSEE